ncbi:MAG: hypothetical protein JWM47_4457 [Acidimicrobiales bacterium]|nr:hypothetical protein [Acidimicrobiales bacterium]
MFYFCSMFADDTPVTLEPSQERSERHARILQRLVEIGMNLAEAVDLQRQEDGADPSELAMKFARIAKAVRQTLALEARLADEDRARRAAAEYRRKAEQARLTRGAKQEGFFHKGQAAMMLEKALVREAPGFDTDEYGEDIGEWLFDDSEAELYADRPVEEIIPEICRLLDVKYAKRQIDEADETPSAEIGIGTEDERSDPADETLPHRRPSPQVHQASQSP